MVGRCKEVADDEPREQLDQPGRLASRQEWEPVKDVSQWIPTLGCPKNLLLYSDK